MTVLVDDALAFEEVDVAAARTELAEATERQKAASTAARFRARTSDHRLCKRPTAPDRTPLSPRRISHSCDARPAGSYWQALRWSRGSGVYCAIHERRSAPERRRGARAKRARFDKLAVVRQAHDDDVPANPLGFLEEPGDDDARFYRATDGAVEVLAAFYGDGRVRIADSQNRRFAGMVSNAHADLLDIANNAWSELFLRTAPDGRIQLELRGGPYDAHVLTCEAL